MIDDLDEVLRQLLIREVPIKNNEVDIAFDQPKREWAARLSRPTINLFLYDMNENKQLRQQGWETEKTSNGKATQRRKPVRVDLYYLITVWAAEPEDEHRLITRTLLALMRQRNIPEDLLPESLIDQPVPIPMIVAQRETLSSAVDLWSVLDNELKPGLTCMITVSLNPYAPITSPIVRTREIRPGQRSLTSFRPQLDLEAGVHDSWSVGGTLHSDKPLDNLRLLLVERNQEVPLLAEGRFVIGSLRAGDYTLEIAGEGRAPVRRKITVPSPDYDLEV
jgi:hypothetical protein